MNITVLLKFKRYVNILLIIAFASLTTEWIIGITNLLYDRITFEIKAAAGGTYQMFYSYNEFHSANNSITIQVQSTQDYKKINFTLKKWNLVNIRFDPPTDIQIRSIKVGNLFYHHTYSGQFLYDIIKPLNDVESIRLIDNIVKIQVKGNDPYLKLSGIGLINHVNFKFIIANIVFRLFLIVFFSSLIFLSYKWFAARIGKFLEENQTSGIPQRLFNSLKILIFSWFLFQMIYFAMNIKKGVSPDERYHVEVSGFYSKPGVFQLENTDATIRYGSLTTEPHFYYVAMGKLLMFKPNAIDDYKYLRFLNILISVISLFFTYLLSKEITSNKLIQLSVLIFQTNILMFVFLSSMVSYDNLVNLTAVASFLFLLRFLKNFSLIYLLLLFTTMVVGGLTKITYLPLILLQLSIILMYSKKIFLHRKIIFSEVKMPKNILTCIIFLVFFAANLSLYGSNLIKYKTIRPGAELVIGKERALKGYGIYMRNFNLLTTAHTREIMPPLEFIPKYFFRTMETIFGVTGHLSMRRDNPELAFYFLLMGLSLLMFIFQFKVIKNDNRLLIFLFLIIGYIFIVFYVNYSGYLQMRSFGVGLQGRYNFPVLSLMIIFSAYMLLSKLSDKAKFPVIMILTFFFVYNSFVWFIARVTPIWFNS